MADDTARRSRRKTSSVIPLHRATLIAAASAGRSFLRLLSLVANERTSFGIARVAALSRFGKRVRELALEGLCVVDGDLVFVPCAFALVPAPLDAEARVELGALPASIVDAVDAHARRALDPDAWTEFRAPADAISSAAAPRVEPTAAPAEPTPEPRRAVVVEVEVVEEEPRTTNDARARAHTRAHEPNLFDVGDRPETVRTRRLPKNADAERITRETCALRDLYLAAWSEKTGKPASEYGWGKSENGAAARLVKNNPAERVLEAFVAMLTRHLPRHFWRDGTVPSFLSLSADSVWKASSPVASIRNSTDHASDDAGYRRRKAAAQKGPTL